MLLASVRCGQIRSGAFRLECFRMSRRGCLHFALGRLESCRFLGKGSRSVTLRGLDCSCMFESSGCSFLLRGLRRRRMLSNRCLCLELQRRKRLCVFRASIGQRISMLRTNTGQHLGMLSTQRGGRSSRFLAMCSYFRFQNFLLLHDFS